MIDTRVLHQSIVAAVLLFIKVLKKCCKCSLTLDTVRFVIYIYCILCESIITNKSYYIYLP